VSTFSLSSWFKQRAVGAQPASAFISATDVAIEPATDAAFRWLLDPKAPAPGPWKAARPIESPEVLEMLRALAADLRCADCPCAWLIRVGEIVVGLISFKDSPDQCSTIEIGYGLASQWRGRGVARAAVAALIRLAQADPRIDALLAETEAANVRSRRLLTHHGFRFQGRRRDPDDGVVDSWRLSLR